MKKTYIIVIVLVIVALVLFFGLKSKKLEAPTTNNIGQMNKMQGVPIPADYNVPLPKTSALVKEFVVTGQNFSFTPAALSVKKGDRVKITFKVFQGFHDFRIDEFKVATHQIKEGGEDSVEFIADKTGSFEYYCSVGSHRAMGMRGTLTVE